MKQAFNPLTGAGFNLVSDGPSDIKNFHSEKSVSFYDGAIAPEKTYGFGMNTYKFDTSGDQSLGFAYPVPHDFITGSQLKLRGLRIFSLDDTPEEYTVTLHASLYKSGDVFGTFTSDEEVANVSDDWSGGMISLELDGSDVSGEIDGQNIEAGDLIVYELKVETSGVNNQYVVSDGVSLMAI